MATSAKTVASPRTLPSMADYAVTVHLVDYKGAHSKIVGRVGQTLMQATAQYGGPAAKVLEDDSGGGGGRNERINSDRWTEMVFGEGAQSYQSHIVVPLEWAAKLPKPSAKEAEVISRLPDSERKQTSRLATSIVLTRELNGLVVHVPDSPPLDT